MHTLWLGAGYSHWAAGLPLANNLFDFAFEPFGVREEARLKRVEALKANWDKEHLSAETEQFIAEVLARNGRDANDLLWYIVRRLSDPFIWVEFHAQRRRRHVFMIDENRCPRPAADFLKVICGRAAGIITTNYDLLVEYSLRTRGFNYGTVGEVLTGRGAYPLSQWRNPVALVGTKPLAKIHGSISWDRWARYTDGRRGLTGNALIVAPTPEKTLRPELQGVWQLAGQILARSDRILVFGFSFNPYDQAVLDLLREQGAHLHSVLLVGPCPKPERAAGLWPRAQIAVAPPPPEGDAAIKSWLRDR